MLLSHLKFQATTGDSTLIWTYCKFLMIIILLQFCCLTGDCVVQYQNELQNMLRLSVTLEFYTTYMRKSIKSKTNSSAKVRLQIIFNWLILLMMRLVKFFKRMKLSIVMSVAMAPHSILKNFRRLWHKSVLSKARFVERACVCLSSDLHRSYHHCLRILRSHGVPNEMRNDMILSCGNNILMNVLSSSVEIILDATRIT